MIVERKFPYGEKSGTAVSAKPLASMGDQDTIPVVNKRSSRERGRFAIGDAILNRYEVLSELGQGGMGVVYRCFDRIGQIEVAVKGLPPEVSHDASSMEDIRENFRLISDLRHPGITGMRTLEADAGTGDYYLVMDVASGRNLRRWAREHQGPEWLEAKLKIVADAAAALDYAHGRRIMHRDIKPENLMVDGEGHVSILDFGLASRIHSSLSRASLAMRSKSGTPAYKSPEQWRGQPQNARTDQYALGVLAYELIAGRLPFDSDDMEILRMSVLSEPVAAIPGVSGSVNAALARALAKNPAERFGTCGEFAAALKLPVVSAGTTGGDDAPVETSPVRAGRLSSDGGTVDAAAREAATRRTFGGVWPVAAVVLVGLAIALAVLWSGRGGRPGMPGIGGGAVSEAAAAHSDLVKDALDAFRRDDYQTGYSLAMQTDRTNPKLQCYIGMCYDRQEPRSRSMTIAKDDWAAREWYEKAARQGDARAMTYLGLFCENGRGSSGKDVKAAEKWFRAAAGQDYPEGKANLKRLAENVKAEAAAEKLMDEKFRAGYTIETHDGRRTAVWREGVSRDEHPHWVTAEKENTWRREDGYIKVDPNGGVLSPLKWNPGWRKSIDANVMAGEREGTWLHRTVCSACGGRKIVSTAERCATCGGSGRTRTESTCQGCGGAGRQTVAAACSACNGRGSTARRCASCGGGGSFACSACGGRGQIPNPSAVVGGIVNLFGPAKGRRRAIPQTGPQTLPCGPCGGRGRVSCRSCGGGGAVSSSCSACSGAGRTTQAGACTVCRGRGRVGRDGACPNCQGGKTFRTQSCPACNGAGEVWRGR